MISVPIINKILYGVYMTLSKHAEIRCRQRGIPEKYVDLIVQYGKPKYKPGGALEYTISKRDKNEIQRQLKKMITQLDKISNKAVLVADNSIITVYHKNK
jgi:hypothetical protein